MTRSLDGNGQFPLMMGTGTCYPAGQNLCPFRNKTAQFGHVFIINRIDFIHTKTADLPAALAAVVSAGPFLPVASIISHNLSPLTINLFN
jgi:hypothetical protein